MDVILGIDIGGSTTKIVGLRADGSVISMLRVRAEDQVTSLYGALGNYPTSNHLTLKDVRRVVLTGVGASFVEGDIYGLPTCKVDEFSASGTGALALSGQSSAVVVTMGTGTAFLHAGPEGVRHLCGSGIIPAVPSKHTSNIYNPPLCTTISPHFPQVSRKNFS